MDSIFVQYWEQKIKNAYNASQWTDQAGQVFEREDISQIARNLNQLGEIGENIQIFVKKAEKLLTE